jgi:vancomycin resistance protein YoaR
VHHEPAISVDPLAPFAGVAEETAPQRSRLPLTPRDRMRRLGTRAVVGVGVLFLVTAWTLFLMRSVYSDRIYPTVYVADMNIGGMSYDDAKAKLDDRASMLNDQAITFTYQGRTWSPKLSDLGIRFDSEGSIENAYAVGREENAWERLSTTAGFLRHDRRLPLTIIVEGEQLSKWFDQVDAELGQPPHDAYLQVNGDQVTIVPEVNGTIVHRQQAQQMIVDAVRQLQPRTNELPVVAITSKLHVADLQAAQQNALSKPVTITFNERSWTFQPAVLGQFLLQTVDPSKTGPGSVIVSFDENKMAKWLSSQLKDEINRTAVDAEVGWNKRLVALTESVDGVKLRQVTLARRVIASMFGDHAEVEAPVTIIKPTIDSNNLDALGIEVRMGAGDSNFHGSDEGRSTNIAVGASLLNGTLVPPGEEFSFNHAIGVISEDLGFVESQVVDGERIGRDIGGGICQVSTTMFRAALLSGLEITEWHPHRYRLSFYEQDGWSPGLDASILQPEWDPFAPGGDFKFENTTDSWMLIESYVQGTQVVVIIYGPDLDLTVDLTEPDIAPPIPPEEEAMEVVDEELDPGTYFQSEAKQDGTVVSYTRKVYDKNGKVLMEDDWITAFSARPDVWKVSPDMRGQSPAGQG